MGKTKKVILFIVEGESEQPIFNNIIIPLIDNKYKDARCFVYGSDITRGNPSNQKARIRNAIEKSKSEYSITLKDIAEIIILTDTDGAFIKESQIFKSGNKIKYYNDRIECKNVNDIKIENSYKSKNILQLIENSNFTMRQHEMAFSVYFVSCNLDHVLYNKQNLHSSKKRDKAELFSEQYTDNPQDFVNFLNNPILKSGDNYLSSWEYIQKENNSLSRCTNLNLYLNKIICEHTKT